jgi:hypothetical protein
MQSLLRISFDHVEAALHIFLVGHNQEITELRFAKEEKGDNEFMAADSPLMTILNPELESSGRNYVLFIQPLPLPIWLDWSFKARQFRAYYSHERKLCLLERVHVAVKNLQDVAVHLFLKWRRYEGDEYEHYELCIPFEPDFVQAIINLQTHA